MLTWLRASTEWDVCTVSKADLLRPNICQVRATMSEFERALLETKEHFLFFYKVIFSITSSFYNGLQFFETAPLMVITQALVLMVIMNERFSGIFYILYTVCTYSIELSVMLDI